MVKIKSIVAKTTEPNNLIISIGLDNGLTTSEEISVHKEASHNIQNTIHFINDIVAPILKGLKPVHHKELDKMISDLNAIHNQDHEINSSLLLSVLLYKSGATLSGTSLLEYVNSLYKSTKNESERRPSLAYILATNDKSETTVDFKEFYIIPARFKSQKEGKVIVNTIAKSLNELSDSTGDSPVELFYNTNADVFQLFDDAIKKTPYKLNHDIYIGFNANAQEWFRQDGKYDLKDAISPLTSEELTKYYLNLEKEYPQLIIESPFANTNWHDWTNLNNGISDSALVSIPTSMVSDSNELKKAISQNSASAITLDFKHVSTISTFFDFASEALSEGWKVIIQSDLGIETSCLEIECALGIGVDFIKAEYHKNKNIDKIIHLISNYEESSSAVS